MMFCRSCGARVEPNAKFCSQCGAATAGPVSTTQAGSGLNGTVASLIFWVVLVVVGVAVWYFARAQQLQ